MPGAAVVGIGVDAATGLVISEVGRGANVARIGVGSDAALLDHRNVHPLAITASDNAAQATGLIYLCIIFSFLDLFFADQPHHNMSDRVYKNIKLALTFNASRI
jgi:hypothetical protein